MNNEVINSQSLDYTDIMNDPRYSQATLAGGCFWCLESNLENTPGIIEVISGYSGGHAENPTYSQVTSGTTGHLETVRVIYDPNIISYDEVLKVFWVSIDPTDMGGQFVDRGAQYGTAIYYHDEEQRIEAEKSRQEISDSGRFTEPIVTAILPVGKFYQAEDYHQDYAKKSAAGYKRYESGSGRKEFKEENWNE